MRIGTGMALPLAGLALVLAGCSPGPERTQDRTGKTPSGESAQDARAADGGGPSQPQNEKEEWMRSTREHLDELKRKVAELKPTFDASKEKVKTEYDQVVADLKSGIQSAEDRLNHVQASTTDEWSSFKEHMKLAVKDLDDLYHAAVAAMKDGASGDAGPQEAPKKEDSSVNM